MDAGGYRMAVNGAVDPTFIQAAPDATGEADFLGEIVAGGWCNGRAARCLRAAPVSPHTSLQNAS